MKIAKLGIEDLDSDHDSFFDCLNQFLTHIKSQKNVTSTELKKMNSFFKNYLDSHFAKEEKIQQEFNYPYQSEHKRVHRILKDRVLELIANLDSQQVDANLIYDVYFEIIKLFEAHIYYIDQDIKKYIMS